MVSLGHNELIDLSTSSKPNLKFYKKSCHVSVNKNDSIYTDGLMQYCSISSALPIEILQSCTKQSIQAPVIQWYVLYNILLFTLVAYAFFHTLLCVHSGPGGEYNLFVKLRFYVYKSAGLLVYAKHR